MYFSDSHNVFDLWPQFGSKGKGKVVPVLN